MIVNGPRSKPVIEYGGGRRFDLGPPILERGQGQQNGWSAITLTEREPNCWLVSATGYAENTGMVRQEKVPDAEGESPSRQDMKT